MISTESDVKMRILLAARQLFAQQGYDGTSVRQICELAGANIALVSYHFGGKENVFAALFATFFPDGNKLEVFESFQDHPTTCILYLIREVTHFRLNNPEISWILEQEIALHSPRISIIQSHSFPIWTKLRKWLERGREQGEFQFRSLDNTMFFVMGAILFQKKTDFFGPLLTEGTQSFDDIVHDTTLFVLRGLLVEGAEELASAPLPLASLQLDNE